MEKDSAEEEKEVESEKMDRLEAVEEEAKKEEVKEEDNVVRLKDVSKED